MRARTAVPRRGPGGRGARSYGLTILTSSGAIFEGRTRAAAAFFSESEQPLAQVGALTLADGNHRKVGDHIHAAQQAVSRELERMRLHAGDHAGTLTLAPAVWTPAHAQFTMTLPAARVILDAIDAWWRARGPMANQVQPGGGSSWFVGGVFPVGG